MRWMLLLLALAAMPARAGDRAERIAAVWADWVAAGPVEVSTLAILRDGVVVHVAARGTDPGAALPLASLSKPITAACVLALGDRLPMEASVAEVLGPGPAGAATVAGLLTHVAGLWPDGTQNNAVLARTTAPMTGEIAAAAIARPPDAGRIGAFAYNNENYAVLGAMIEAVSGTDYATFCAEAVLAPLGLETAALAGPWAAHGPWGGWRMSAADYARFAWAFIGPGSPVGDAPADWPHADLGGVAYGPGLFWRTTATETFAWGYGQLCWDGTGNGSYVARYGNDLLVVVLHDDCSPGTDRALALDAALFDAATAP